MFKQSRILGSGALLAALGLVLHPGTGAADPWSILGFDGRSIAVGGALAGGAEGPAAIYYNPAGLIKNKRREMSTSLIRTDGFLKFDGADNPEIINFAAFPNLTTDQVGCGSNQQCVNDVNRYNSYVANARVSQKQYERYMDLAEERARAVRSLNGATVGLSLPLAYEPQDAQIAVGVAAFLPIGPILYQRLKGANTPYFLRYDDAVHRVVIDAAVAFELKEIFRIGLGVDALVDINAQPELLAILPPEMRLGFPPSPNFQDIQVFIDGDVTIPPRLALTAGLQVSPTDWIDLGMRFRDEQGARIKVKSVISLETPYGRRSVPAAVAAGGGFTPRQVAGGVSLRPIEGLALHGELAWRQWSNYVPPFAIEASIENIGDAACDVVRSFQDLEPLLQGVSDATGIEISTEDLCNLARGLNQIDINTYDPEGNEFSDTFSPSFGVEYGAERWNLAAGYRYEPTPVPDQRGIYTILDSDTHIMSTGFNYRFLDWLEAGVYFQYHALKTRTVERDRQTVRRQNSSSDAFPDLNFSTSNPQLDALQNAIRGSQIVTPGYPGYTIGGGYMAAGLQLATTF